MQRVVLDTNVIVSGALTPKGPPATILDAWRKNRFLLITSEAIIDEVKDVLNDPILRRSYPHLTDSRVGRLISLLRNQSIIVPGKLAVSVVKGDPDDDIFFAVALEGSTDTIVSGDKTVLGIGSFRGIRVISPSAFAKQFKR